MEIRSASSKDNIEFTTGLSTSTSSSPLQEVHSAQLQPSFPLQSKTPDSLGVLPRPNLIARWEIENEKLVCHWVIDDRPRNSSTHF